MTNQEKVMNFAARLDQIDVELQAIWKDKNESLWASHEAGVTIGVLRSLSRRMQKLSGLMKS